MAPERYPYLSRVLYRHAHFLREYCGDLKRTGVCCHFKLYFQLIVKAEPRFRTFSTEISVCCCCTMFMICFESILIRILNTRIRDPLPTEHNSLP